MSDFDLVQEPLQPTLAAHDAKEDQASDNTHFHRYLATEILTRILSLRSALSVAKREHSDNPTMGGAGKLL